MQEDAILQNHVEKVAEATRTGGFDVIYKEIRHLSFSEHLEILEATLARSIQLHSSLY